MPPFGNISAHPGHFYQFVYLALIYYNYSSCHKGNTPFGHKKHSKYINVAVIFCEKFEVL